jgi:hypothetical protein
MAPPVGCPSRASWGTLSLRPRSKRDGCAPHEQRRWGGPQPRQQEPSLLRTKDHLRSRCWETGRCGRLPNQRRGLPRWVCVACCGRPSGVRDPAQLPWASRSRASRCPSGGRSEICVPCGWQHSPSSDACSCQVRPSQHQPWLVSTCSVTAHPFHRFCYPPASTPRGATHTSPAAGTGPRLDNDDRGPRTVGCGTGLLAAHAGWSSADDGDPSAPPTQHRLLPGWRPAPAQW